MITKVPHSLSEARRLSVQMKAYQKTQDRLAKVESAPLRDVDPNLPFCIIGDIDGTLSLRCNRGVYDFPNSIHDAPCDTLVTLLGYWREASDNQILIITGREEQYREVTEKWLHLYSVAYDQLLMRRSGDRRPAALIKEELWAEHIRNKYNVIFAVDDNQKVIDMWRSHGLYCLTADNSRE